MCSVSSRMCQSFRYTCIQPTTFTILLIFKKQIQYFCLKLEIKSLTVAKILSLVVCLYSARIESVFPYIKRKGPSTSILWPTYCFERWKIWLSLVSSYCLWWGRAVCRSSTQLCCGGHLGSLSNCLLSLCLKLTTIY